MWSYNSSNYWRSPTQRKNALRWRKTSSLRKAAGLVEVQYAAALRRKISPDTLKCNPTASEWHSIERVGLPPPPPDSACPLFSQLLLNQIHKRLTIIPQTVTVTVTVGWLAPPEQWDQLPYRHPDIQWQWDDLLHLNSEINYFTVTLPLA